MKLLTGIRRHQEGRIERSSVSEREQFVGKVFTPAFVGSMKRVGHRGEMPDDELNAAFSES